MREAYKIVEVGEDGELRTLFHGVGGSRGLERGGWLEAVVRPVVDGGGGTRYVSGWHTLPTREDAVRYLRHFNCRQERLRIVRCEIDEWWRKTHSRRPVLLSRYIRFTEEVE